MDFAYSVHTQIGQQCVGAKVNGKIVPLRYQLKNGDTIEITTASGHQPSKDWLKFVKTSRARTKIRQWVKAEARERSVDLGREICEREFKKYHLDFAKIIKSEEMKKIVDEFSYQTLDDLMAEVGYGNVSAKQILGRLAPARKARNRDGRKNPVCKRLAQKLRGEPSGIQIRGIQDMMVRFGKVLQPSARAIPSRVHHPRTGGHGAYRGLSQRPGKRSGAADSSILEFAGEGGPRRAGAGLVPLTKRGCWRKSARPCPPRRSIFSGRISTRRKTKKRSSTLSWRSSDLKHLQNAFRALSKLKNVLKVERLRGLTAGEEGREGRRRRKNVSGFRSQTGIGSGSKR